MRIESLGPGEEPPMTLLLLADPSEKLVKQYLRRGVCYVARAVERTALGAYVLLPTRPDTAELVNVAVDECHQGRGIGKALVLHAIETAKREGYRTIEVGTGNSGVGQLALYQKCGFRIVGVDVDFFVRHYDEPIVENGIPCRDMIRMSQDL
ncbi:GNAT family N-acetyltransferase [Cohnella sp. GCM10012308]|uniref:GNAT family N-acetyltransferase n=1 Tax=Cohnella sp. GCM10012308 TaxID=3317329 RepID=UPI00361FF45F